MWKMRYFSFASRCRIINQIGAGKRSVSYKTKKNFIAAMSDIMSDMSPEENVKSTAVAYSRCTNFEVNVILNGAYGPTSLFINRSGASYLFNCGEGMQRISIEHGFKVLWSKAIFITYHSWKNIGGIMGHCLSSKAAGVKEIVIYCPPIAKNIILGIQIFMKLNISIKVVVETPRHVFDDSLFKVQFVPIYPKSTTAVQKALFRDISTPRDSDADSDHSGSPSPKPRSRSKEKNSSNINGFNEIYGLCYICETPEFGMHLDVKKCLELGVPYGPKLGDLKNKNDIVLPNGTVVHWRDVCHTVGQSEYFIVADCPGEEFLDPFVNEPEFKRYQGNSKMAASVVYHFTEKNIMETDKYIEWMSRFPPTTTHIVLNTANRLLDHVEPYRLQEKLNILDPQIFPKLREDHIPEVREEFSGTCGKHIQVITKELDEPENNQKKRKISGTVLEPEVLKPGFSLEEMVRGIKVIRSVSSLMWKVYPKCPYQFTHSVHIDRKHCLNEILDINDVLKELKELKKAKEKWEASEECAVLPEYPKILFLGTGSSAPSSFRSTSAILVELEKGHLLLLDCGEGTYGQMVRFFGKDKIGDVLKRLRLIFVSHHHADHHLGLLDLLRARNEVLSACRREEYLPELQSFEMDHLLMILPSSVRDFIQSNDKFQSLMYDARIISSSVACENYNTLKRYTNFIGIINFRTAFVIHSHESYGLTFSTKDGYKITYSGDTMPCENLVQLGKDSDMLIHEATFEEGLETMAKQKKHSTIAQALDIGKRMEAKFVLLTHFSQRYCYLPHLKGELPKNAGIVFDNMMVSPKSMPFLWRFEPFYKKIFAEKVIVLKDRAAKRMCKNESKLKAAELQL